MPIKSFYATDDSDEVIKTMIIGKNEKRDFIRMSIDSVVSFTRSDSTESYSGKTVDLSATGMRFVTKTPVKVGEMLEVTVQPGIDITPPLDVTMAVVRVVRSSDGQYDVAGVTKTHASE